jgi:hypothetical protein
MVIALAEADVAEAEAEVEEDVGLEVAPLAAALLAVAPGTLLVTWAPEQPPRTKATTINAVR